MANELRGQVLVTLDGEKIPLRLTYDKMVALESELNTPIPLLFRKLGSGAYLLTDLESFAKHAMQCSGRKWQPAVFRKHVEENGTVLLAGELQSLLVIAIAGSNLGGEADAEGNATAPAGS